MKLPSFNWLMGNKNDKIKKLTEVEQYGTSRTENLYFTWSLSTEYEFGVPKV